MPPFTPTGLLPLDNAMPKKLLFVTRHAPYGTASARDALDAVLTAAAYEQDISLLFMDDGVFQLLRQQEPQGLEQKNFAATLPVLPLYEVENIYVHLESMEKRAITPADLVLDNVQLIDSSAVGELFNQQDQLLSF
jgi:tRNA 2-thiouridine synthesizing protein C